MDNYENKTKNKDRYLVADTIFGMRKMLSKRYKVIDVELDCETGFCFLVFDTYEFYKTLEDIKKDNDGKIIIEKIFNINEQAKYYLKEEFGATVIDVGIDKRMLKNGNYKNFFYIKFLCDNKLFVPKNKWMRNNRNNTDEK